MEDFFENINFTAVSFNKNDPILMFIMFLKNILKINVFKIIIDKIIFIK